MRARVLLVGPAYLDVVAAPLAAWPEPGEELRCEGVELAAGGFAIAATALRRLGVGAVLAAPLGEDGPGRYLAGLLADEGVELLKVEVPRTPVTLALNRAGDRAFVTVGPPDDEALARAGALALAEVPAPPWLHLSCRGPWSAPLAREARRRGAFVSLDCGTDPPWLASPGLRQVLAEGDLYMPNAREAACVTGRRDPREAAAALRDLVPRAIVKLGAEGVLCADATGVRLHGTVPRAVRDATGAGDVFDAGYIAGTILGLDEADAVALGQFAAGEAVGALGGATAAPTLAACREALGDLGWPM